MKRLERTFKKPCLAAVLPLLLASEMGLADDSRQVEEALALAYPCSGSVFNDVGNGHWACGFIEELVNLAITTGCQQDDPGTSQNEAAYCPESAVTRAQMAVFFVRALEETLFDSIDGTGSGLDADLLDGHDSSYFLDWGNLSGMPAGIADGDDDTLGGLSCANGQIAKWNGSAWNCAVDDSSTPGISGVTAGVGLTGGGNSGNVTLNVDDTTFQRRVVGSCPPGQSIRSIGQSGSVICELDDTASAPPAWELNGNDIAPGEYLGTNNNLPLLMKVAGKPVMEFRDGFSNLSGLNGGHAPSLLAGSSLNVISDGLFGVTISGGHRNLVTGTSNHFATIGGGTQNQAMGVKSVVAGGEKNQASSNASTVAGGSYNVASGSGAFVGAGYRNTASGVSSVISGGANNVAGGRFSQAGGRKAIVRDGVTAGNSLGDEGTFVWADSTNAEFVSTGSDQFLIRAGGGVGIGTNAPRRQLHVQDSTTAVVMRIENTDTSSIGDGLNIVLGRTVPGPNNNFITFLADGGNTAVGAIDGDGTGGVNFRTGAGDFAEYLPTEVDDLQPGEVVALRRGKLWRNTVGAERLFVISTAPAITGNSDMESDHGKALAAFTGQVPVRVQGQVKAGDWLVASGSGDGKARAMSVEALQASDYGLVVGRALEDSREGQVRTLVGLPPVQLLAMQQRENRRLRQRLVMMETRLREGQQLKARVARLEAALGGRPAPVRAALHIQP